jgi:hypothetical protein
MNVDWRVATLGITDCTRVRVSVSLLDRGTIMLTLIGRRTTEPMILVKGIPSGVDNFCVFSLWDRKLPPLLL